MTTGSDFPGGASADDRVLYFSTPLAYQCGNPVGNSTNRDVAQFFDDNGQTVANYIPNTGNFDFTAWISGPWSTCPCNAAIFTANKRCAAGGGYVTYQWHRSVNGFPYQYVGGGPSYDNWFPCSTTIGTTYVLRLTATDEDGIISISTKSGQVSSCGGGWDAITPNLEEAPEDITAYPNPNAGNQFTVQVPGGLMSGDISLLNANLQSVYEQRVNLSSLEFSHAFSLKQKLPSGFYFVRVWNAETETTQIAKLLVK